MKGASWRIRLGQGILIRLGLWLLPIHGSAQTSGVTNQVGEAIRRLKDMSLAELLDERVTIVSKTTELSSQAPAAVFVVTGEDIRRSGATSLPEALRLSPNLSVAQVNSSEWAVSARGFNNTLANKLLVMIDGRTIYTPLYAGVFWDAQHVLLEDVDRIEVVSGAGGALWGANAVNGVINVITRSAKDTQGTYITGGGGSFLQDFGAIRYGAAASSNLFYRVYVQRFDRNETSLANGRSAQNGWDLTQGGFRTDWDLSELSAFTFQGDFYGGTQSRPTSSIGIDGQNLLGRWTRRYANGAELKVQTYFDRTWREIPNAFVEDLKTYDIDLQHQLPLGERQTLVVGGGYRLMQDRITNTRVAAFLPPNRDLQLASAFFQDEIELVPERLKTTLGARIEHNDYSGIEVQPSVRLAYMPAERQIVWAAVSRAVRAPSRIDTDYYTPAPPVPVGVPRLSGGPGFEAEDLLAYELGYRVQPTDRLQFSISPYYNFYKDLRSLDLIGPGSYVLANHYRGEIWGVELTSKYQLSDNWRIQGGYNYLHKNLWPDGPGGVNASVREGNDPQHQFSFQSILNLWNGFQLDATGRFVDTLDNPRVDSYFSIDVRLAWQYKRMEFSVVGQNLYDSKHPEFGTQEIPRSVYGKITWRF
ncbi:MAG: TonB-dependent receptor [Verrucomicrobiales bacterium]|nr:TonB-dependent receptor [Verrucomicrobiales bacterium]